MKLGDSVIVDAPRGVAIALGRALLAVRPRTETALVLMRHRLQVGRGRAILDCLAHAKQGWARTALEKGAAHALAYRVED